MFTSLGMFYQEFMASICKEREAKKYLEIGVQAGVLMSKIEVDHAIGIDPAYRIDQDITQGKKSVSLYRMTSDRFFADVGAVDVDVAFLDGMHLFEYLLRDIANVEKACRKNGLIIMHDCLPFDGEMISRRDTGRAWTGDVWKIVPILEKHRPDLRLILLDSAPTGLVCITNLDPKSTLIDDRYLDIVEEFALRPNDTEAIEDFYRERTILSAADIIAGYGQSRYFRT